MNPFREVIYLNHVHPIAAPYQVSHRDGIAWLMKAAAKRFEEEPQSGQDRVLNLYERLIGNTGLQFRSTIVEDYTHCEWEQMQLYRKGTRMDGSSSAWYAPPLERRMEYYDKYSRQMLSEAFADCEKAPQFLIEVSCTGYYAPYPMQELVLAKNWQSQSQLFKLGHMGCYAAVPALNLAARLILSDAENAREASIFTVELSTLHLRPDAQQLDLIIANILFADGAARLDLSREKKPGSLALLHHTETLIPGTADLMTWKLCDSSFYMTLNRKVNVKIADVIAREVKTFLEPMGMTWRDMDRFAIHPGGTKIIDTVQESLELNEEQVRHSKQVLANWGNMSSSTLPFVWSGLQRDPHVRRGEYILSMAFGPGLMLCMNLMQKC